MVGAASGLLTAAVKVRKETMGKEVVLRDRRETAREEKVKAKERTARKEGESSLKSRWLRRLVLEELIAPVLLMDPVGTATPIPRKGKRKRRIKCRKTILFVVSVKRR